MIKSIAIFRAQGNASMPHKKGDTFIKDCIKIVNLKFNQQNGKIVP